MSALGRSIEQRAGILHWSISIEKQVGDRVSTILGDPMLLSVFQKFGSTIFRRSSVFHGLGKFLSDNNVQGKCCFEIGTWNGLTAAILSRHFDHVVTVDVVDNRVKYEVLESLGIKNVECIHIKNNLEKFGVLRSIQKSGGTVDCSYIDGNHAEDTEDDWNLVKGYGRVLFHECWPFQRPVWELVNALPQEEVTYGGCGLAMWTRT